MPLRTKTGDRLSDEPACLGRIPLLIGNEVGYIPVDSGSVAGLPLVFSRYERSWLIVFNKSLFALAEIIGDAVAVAAMVDRLAPNDEAIVLNDDNSRRRGNHKEEITAEQTH